MDNKIISRYWLKHYDNGTYCVLCANTCFIDTRGKAITSKGEDVGTFTYCFCPNGQQIRKKLSNLPHDPAKKFNMG